MTDNSEEFKSNLINNLENEIKDLENKIEHNSDARIELYKEKQHQLRLLNLRRFYIYVVTTGMIIVIGKITNHGLPIYNKDKLRYGASITDEIDSLGNESIIKCYSYYPKNDHSDDVLSHYSTWSYNDSKYLRTIVNYSLDGLSNEDIKRLLITNDLSHLSQLGQPEYEYKENISKSDLDSPESLKATIYSYDSKDYIYVQETKDVNSGLTALYFTSIIILNLLGPFTIRLFSNKFNYNKELNKINEEYDESTLNIDTLKLKLKIKKENYETMVRPDGK
jgi:hypothetical protein